MSHRVTTETEIREKDLACEALRKAGMSFQMNGDHVIEITSGSLRGAVIDLNTGLASGSTDLGHKHDDFRSLGRLKQLYAEAKAIVEMNKQNILIENRVTEGENIVLYCAMVGE